MICITLASPDATQTIGLTTCDFDVTVGGVVCPVGYLSSVSEWSHRIDISRGQGGTPEPLEWSFDMIDWTGLVRRSAGILAGAASLVGWRVELYISTTGDSWTRAGGLAVGSFEVVGVVASGDVVRASVRERWIGDLRTIGVSAGNAVVGWVAGGRQITVKTLEMADPVAIEYQRNSGWMEGAFPSPTIAPIPATTATSKTGRTFHFQCASGQGFALYSQLLTGTNYITGAKHSEVVGNVALNVDRVDVQTSQEFADLEDIGDVALYSAEQAERPIVYGAASLLGFVDRAAILTPSGDSRLANYVLYFTPRSINPDGFSCFTHLPCRIAFETPVRWGTNQTFLVEGDDYSGAVADIATDPTTEPLFDIFGDDLAPEVPSSSMVMRADIDSEPSTERQDLRLKMRVILDDPSQTFDAYDFDVKDRIIVKNVGLPSVTPTADMAFPFNGSAWPHRVSTPLTCGVQGDLSTCPPYIADRLLKGAGWYVPGQRFDSIEAANETLGMAVRGNDIIGQYQCCAVRVYGVSTLKYGSSYAVVQPGASPWWTGPLAPSPTAQALMAATGWSMVADIPSNAATASQWGAYLAPDLTYAEAARQIAREHWIVMGRGANQEPGEGDGELLEFPSFTLGDRGDIVTEPVVEYDEWAGEFRRRAYIAHVDEEFNGADPARYFGGWDSDESPEGYGLAIWNACRKAYLYHGVQASETYQWGTVSDPSVIGRMMIGARNGVSRLRWMALQPRYLTLAIREAAPVSWAGNTISIPTVVADWAGYDLSDTAGMYLVITEKRWDPMTLRASYEVALPPVVTDGAGVRIIQTLDATDRITERLDGTARYIQEL